MSWMSRTVRTRPRPLSLPLVAAPQVQAFVDSLSIRVIGESAVSGLQWFIAAVVVCGHLHCSYRVLCKKMPLKLLSTQ